MAERATGNAMEKVQEWVGQRLNGNQVKDGMVYYHGLDKIFKVVLQRNGWNMQFNVPVPDCKGLQILTADEARAKKLGRSRWIYKGESEEDAKLLIDHVLSGLNQRHLVEPAMSRDQDAFADVSAPSFKRIERLLEHKILPQPIVDILQQAYDLLQEGKYADLVILLEKAINEVTSFLLKEHGIECQGLTSKEKIDLLAEHQVISQTLKDQLEVIFYSHTVEKGCATQERAYPMALMLMFFMSKFLKICS